MKSSGTLLTVAAPGPSGPAQVACSSHIRWSQSSVSIQTVARSHLDLHSEGETCVPSKHRFPLFAQSCPQHITKRNGYCLEVRFIANQMDFQHCHFSAWVRRVLGASFSQRGRDSWFFSLWTSLAVKPSQQKMLCFHLPVIPGWPGWWSLPYNESCFRLSLCRSDPLLLEVHPSSCNLSEELSVTDLLQDDGMHL